MNTLRSRSARRRGWLLAPAVSLLSLLGCQNAFGTPRAAIPPDFPAAVAEVRKTWNMPGVAVAVVQDGEVTYAEGFGVRELARRERVDADTTFGIASVTKLLITAGIGVLIDEGKVRLDGRVIEYLPQFRVADPYVTANVTLRDLLSHRAGFDFDERYLGIVEQVGALDSADLVQRGAAIGQRFSLRERWRYENYGFFVAAEVITRISGERWHEFVRKRVAMPLGMQNTWARSWDFLPRANVLATGDGWSDRVPRGLASLPAALNIAVPHIMWPKFEPQLAYEPKELERTTVHFHRSPIDPCQGAWSSARDLARFAAQWLPQQAAAAPRWLGQQTREQLLEWAATVDERWPLLHGPRAPDEYGGLRNPVGHAAGFAIYDYDGHVLLGHDGWELGYETLVRIDRERRLAVVVLVNNALYEEGEIATLLLARRILDWHYDRPPAQDDRGAFERYRAAHTTGIREYREKQAALDARRDPRLEPTLPLRAYAGTYRHPVAGDLVIALHGEQLVASTDPSAQWLLRGWRGDTFDGDWQGALIGRKMFRFVPDAAGGVAALELPDDGLVYQRLR
jgi:CubicO group peptidase (beta-lactamase class C family)